MSPYGAIAAASPNGVRRITAAKAGTHACRAACRPVLTDTMSVYSLVARIPFRRKGPGGVSGRGAIHANPTTLPAAMIRWQEKGACSMVVTISRLPAATPARRRKPPGQATTFCAPAGR